MQKIVDWALSRYPRETARANETERLDATMITTAVNRYNASNRVNSNEKSDCTLLVATFLLRLEMLCRTANRPKRTLRSCSYIVRQPAHNEQKKYLTLLEL